MKKISLVLVIVLIIGCTEKQSYETAGEAKTIRIGISKMLSHPALDGIEQGIQDQLEELGYKEIAYDLQNANGDPNTAKQIAVKFKNDAVDIAVGIATPTSQALASTMDDTVIVFSGVTDPLGAGLVPSLEKGGENITGYSDLTPVEEQIDLLASLIDLKRLGHVYSSGEANAVTLAQIAREASEQRGIEFIETSVANSSEVKQAAEVLLHRVDAIYVSTDNTVVSALASLAVAAIEEGIPLISADTHSAKEQPVLVALGFDYYQHGRATGRLIARILKGESPSTIPTQYMTAPGDLDQLVLNLDVAEELGIDIPPELLERASVVIEDGAVEEL